MSTALGALHWLDGVAEVPDAGEPPPARADVVIVGGGYVGAATAYWLARLGVGAVLLERRGIATGASGRNAGFIAPGLGMAYAEAVATFGHESALARLAFTRAGRDLALAMIEEIGIACDLEAQGGLTVAASAKEWQSLRASGEALVAHGAPIQVLTRDELGPHLAVPVPQRFHGGLYNPETLLVNPAKLARGIAEGARRLGARLFTHTNVLALTDTPDGRVAVETDRGEISAARVVLATNAYSPLLVGFLRQRITPVRGQIFATDPAPPTFRRAMSANYGYEYWSQRADGRIILGGGRWAAPDMDEGYYTEELNPTIQSALYAFLTDAFPTLRGVGLHRQWSGIMGFSTDGYPFIGPLPGRERVIVAAGFTGHGGPYFTITGKCVAELIAHGESGTSLEAYAPGRSLS